MKHLHAVSLRSFSTLLERNVLPKQGSLLVPCTLTNASWANGLTHVARHFHALVKGSLMGFALPALNCAVHHMLTFILDPEGVCLLHHDGRQCILSA